LLGASVILGQRVTVLQAVIPQYRLTRWLAPALGCEDLYYKSERVDGSSVTISAEARTSALKLGEPDAHWFDPGEGFTELKPSEAERRMLEDLNIQDPETKTQIQNEGH
jgi:hypothetical protein